MSLQAGRFPGGIHPDSRKEATAGLSTETAPLFTRYVVPLAQHIGAPAEALVKRGDTVRRGTPLGRPAGFVSSPVHSPTSGTVKAVKALPHPWGPSLPAVEIESDGLDTPEEPLPPLPADAEPARIVERIREAGVVGMGGAAFPTHVKLSPPKDKPIDTLVLNGAECEPYLTSDHRLMLDRPADVVAGARLLARVLGVRRVCIGIEANKPDALAALDAVAGDGVEIFALRVMYPQGAEKQLIQAILRRQVPAGGLPMDVGVVVQNVGTAVAVRDAVFAGLPLTDRLVTLSGRGIAQPGNLLLRVGCLVSDVVEWRGGVSPRTVKAINGGPMMGLAMASLEVPVLKGTSGLLFQEGDEAQQFEHHPCIRCGRCVDVCPMGLMACLISNFTENERYDDAGELHVTDCIECGSCAYVCPSRRALVHHLKRGKAEVLARRRRATAS